MLLTIKKKCLLAVELNSCNVTHEFRSLAFLRITNTGLHNSESSKGQIGQHKFAGGRKIYSILLQFERNSGKTIKYISEVGLLQYFLQWRQLSRAACGMLHRPGVHMAHEVLRNCKIRALIVTAAIVQRSLKQNCLIARPRKIFPTNSCLRKTLLK